MFVSPFLYDAIEAMSRGTSPYLAVKRAEFNRRRRDQESARWAAENGVTAESYAGIFRSVEAGQ